MQSIPGILECSLSLSIPPPTTRGNHYSGNASFSLEKLQGREWIGQARARQGDQGKYIPAEIEHRLHSVRDGRKILAVRERP